MYIHIQLTDICVPFLQVCAEDNNNRIALNVCGGLQPLVDLTLTDAGGVARSALNAVMKVAIALKSMNVVFKMMNCVLFKMMI